ncbi:MAG: hypothetical protein ACFFDH_00590 [Promethearchaeota archaeon]
MEQNKTKETKKKTEEMYFKGVKFEITPITKMPFNEVSEFLVNGYKYKVEVKFNEDRAKWQVWINYPGTEQKRSLSFFPNKDTGYHNVYLNILSHQNIGYATGKGD